MSVELYSGQAARRLLSCAATHPPLPGHLHLAGMLYCAGQQSFLADASLTTVGTHALYGVVLAAQAEYAEQPVRVNELRIHGVIRRHSEPCHPGGR